MTPVQALIVFLFYGFIGWCIDSAYRSLVMRRLELGGFSSLPFTPSYGIGAILILLVHPYVAHVSLLGQWFFYAVLIGWFEIVASLVSEKLFHRRLWDYSEARFDIADGRTDIFHSVLWGLLALILVYVLQPTFFAR